MVRNCLLLVFTALLSAVPRVPAPRRFEATGLVLAVDAPNQTITISHAAVPSYMEAMSMPFHVRDAKLLAVARPGDTVAFTLIVDKTTSRLTALRVTEFQSAERDPALASRLKLLDTASGKPAAAEITPGQTVPDFTLTDQMNRPVALANLRGKVVVLNFIYTRCPLPDYCFRLSNNLGRLQKRFAGRHDLVLLTITFDPVHDVPEVLARYAQIWKADPAIWHFLTGPTADVERVCEMFGVAHWRDDGLFTHSLHTVVIDRAGKAVANLEGNRFTAQQLGDLAETVLNR